MMLPALTIRPRQDDDDEFILRVTEQELVPTLERAWRFRWDAGHARKFMIDLHTIGETLIAALPGGELVGYSWFLVLEQGRILWPRRVFWLNYIVIDGAYQGQGFGSQMLLECEAEAFRRRCASMELWVQRENEGATRFYRRHNFKRIGTRGGNIHLGKSTYAR